MVLSSCNKNEQISTCPDTNSILDEYESDQHYILTNDGDVYIKNNGDCEYYIQYFSPGFENNYYIDNGTTYTYFNEYPIPVLTQLIDNFESIYTFLDLFITSPSAASHHWTDFILQSPANPTIEEYVDLRKCILAGNCDFEDNRIDLKTDILNNSGNCIKFTAIEPTPNMITSKSSLSNSLMFADKNDEIMVEADFYIESGFPFSIVDFENKWFEGHPGIRLVFDDNNNIAVELKYGLKPWYRQKTGSELSFPSEQWVNIKWQFDLSETDNGTIKVWQDNVLIIDETGKTLPTSNSIQSNIELGITATDQHTIMYVDNFKIMINKNEY